VREDAEIDLALAYSKGPDARVAMVASGGCTAAALALLPLGHLHLVDPNPAQIALTHLKLALLKDFEPGERLSLLGHRPCPASKRRSILNRVLEQLGLDPYVLGPPELVFGVGPDGAGRYEMLFGKLREALSSEKHSLAELLTLTDTGEQTRRVAPGTPLGRALDGAFRRVMALPNLLRLFGRGAVANRALPFHRHFAIRTRRVLASLPAAGNPYLAQLFLGRFSGSARYRWLKAPRPDRLPLTTFETGGMLEALQGSPPRSFDLVHLSNILDWLSPRQAAALLRAAFQALDRGGRVVVRQLNSMLDIPGLAPEFGWRNSLAEELHARDRSFFYRALHIGGRA
jgi:S-adenosylmethionine-diacylglycerol 3-amino-3-carboxypropyl transferase